VNTLKAAPVALALMFGSTSSASAQTRTDALLKSCSQKTVVWGRVDGKLEVVGHGMNGLCQGYLIGVYEAMLTSKAICAPAEAPTPEFLFVYSPNVFEGRAAESHQFGY
jgi:hypothetical protein